MVGLDKMEIRDIPMPEPKEKEVLVEMEYVGICGSDVHYFHDGRCGSYVVEGDFMLGHECAGTVVALGEGVQNLKVGDRVALEPGITCGECEFCKRESTTICVRTYSSLPHLRYRAAMRITSHSQRICASNCRRTSAPKKARLSSLFPLDFTRQNQGNVQLGDSVVILGAGCIGLVTLLACKAHGASDITVVDVIPKRLDYAMKLGATRVINGKEKDAVEEIMKLTNGVGVEKVFETAGLTVYHPADTLYRKESGNHYAGRNLRAGEDRVQLCPDHGQRAYHQVCIPSTATFILRRSRRSPTEPSTYPVS